MSVRFIQGDTIETLRTLPSDSAHCIVTSPPFWGLRQYLFDGAVCIRRDLDEATRASVEKALTGAGIRPR